MTWTPGWMKLSLFSQAQWNYGKKGNDRQDWTVLGITEPLLNVEVASSSDQSWAGDIPYAPGGSANQPGGELIPLALPSCWRSSYLSSLKHIYCRFRFAFPDCCASVSTTIWGLTECFLACCCVWHHNASDQETHSVMKEAVQWAHVHRINWSNCIFCLQEAPGLI